MTFLVLNNEIDVNITEEFRRGFFLEIQDITVYPP